MSMTRADAKNYIARVLSAVQSQQAQVWAEEALQRGFTDFQLARNWEFLLKDTSGVRYVGAPTYSNGGSTYSTAQFRTAFRGANVGQQVVSAAFSEGETTITGISYLEDGSINAVTFADGAIASNAYHTDLGADIIINVGQSEYNLPPDFYAPATTRLLGDDGYKVEYIRNGLWYRAAVAPDTSGVVDFYSLFNARSPLTTNYGETKLRLRRPPDTAGVLRIEYFRTFDRDSDPLDIPDDILYKFLDYCRALILETRAAAEQPGAYTQRAISGLAVAAMADQEPVDDENLGLYSQMDVWRGRIVMPE
jgi:hypothetical protein